MATRMQQRRGSASDWATANEILADGSVGVEKNTGKFKIGDGVTAWNDLPYSAIPLQTFDTLGDLLVGAGDNAVVKLARGSTDQVLATKSDGTLYWADAPKAVASGTVTTAGDLIVGSGAGTVTRLGKGSNNQMLAVVAGALTWVTPSADVPLSTVTAAGDLVVGSGGGAVTRLAKGSNGQTLAVVGGALTWLTPDAVPKSIINAGGDLILGAGAGAVTTLPVGANGKVLTVAGATPSWVTPTPAVPLSLFTAAGDLVVGNGSGGATRLGVGSNGQVLGISGGVPTYITVTSTIVCTSGTRPAHSAGLHIYETDTGAEYVSNGSIWLAVPNGNVPQGFMVSAVGTAKPSVQRGTFVVALTAGVSATTSITMPTSMLSGATPAVVLGTSLITGSAAGVIINGGGSSLNSFTYKCLQSGGTYTGNVTGTYIATDA